MPTERTDVIKLGEQAVTVIGDDVQVGQPAPDFTVLASGWVKVQPLVESHGKVIILSAVPSLDTDVCDRETRRFNAEAASLSEDIVIYTLSTDTPMAQKRWCGAAGVERVKVVSDVLEAEFAVRYGLLIKERRYMRRAVFVVNRAGVLTYVAYMPTLGQEPDYAEVLAAARAAL